MALDGLSKEAARQWLEQVVRDEMACIERRKRAQSDSREAGYARLNSEEVRVMGHALRLLARDGVSAELGDEEKQELVSDGVPKAAFERVEAYLSQAAGEVLAPSVELKIQNGISAITGDALPSAHDFLDARTIYLRGRAAVYLNASQRRDPALAEALKVAEALEQGGSEPHTPVTQETEPAFDPAIEGHHRSLDNHENETRASDGEDGLPDPQHCRASGRGHRGGRYQAPETVGHRRFLRRDVPASSSLSKKPQRKVGAAG